ncbi:hypothetical protein C2S53_016213 [Perilla frutescens var. hirtella]|uniref:Uncharacterized protein n=1 Tax=Perilla frutescens var. hirtella TaxID=608512 RepID=A0AAD4P7C2_PERFH|nr:hypothetical protein C2S53_016213 [Perilla frutescens var. hirtella]
MNRIKKKKNLEADDEVFLLIDVEIVELFELLVENSDKPRAVRRRIISGGGCRHILEKLLQGLVLQILVPPFR